MTDVIPHVFAKSTMSLGGQQVVAGSHWPADDPLVRAHPEMFSADPRYGMSWSGAPPAYMAEPPVESATARPGERRTVTRRG